MNSAWFIDDLMTWQTEGCRPVRKIKDICTCRLVLAAAFHCVDGQGQKVPTRRLGIDTQT